jgi:hypothetical protein
MQSICQRIAKEFNAAFMNLTPHTEETSFHAAMDHPSANLAVLSNRTFGPRGGSIKRSLAIRTAVHFWSARKDNAQAYSSSRKRSDALVSAADLFKHS